MYERMHASGFARNFSRQERTLNNSFAEKPALRSFARSQNMSALISGPRPNKRVHACTVPPLELVPLCTLQRIEIVL